MKKTGKKEEAEDGHGATELYIWTYILVCKRKKSLKNGGGSSSVSFPLTACFFSLAFLQ
jgi:hypothetical protein